MKKFLAVIAAALTLATAGAAAAQDYRRGGNDRNEWRGGGGEITVRDLRGRTHRFDRRDNEWATLVRSPYAFRPGLLYVYTDDCRRNECQVYIYEPGQRRARGHLWAPPLRQASYDNRYDRRDDWRDDRRDDRWDRRSGR
jgi:hypothetical protein